ncbi:hypothetical protein [Thalassospira sp. TSL5-1]|uniref:hypothetical protein n=1 Tax=Thalassospira sp. TSL5-1 TaxID=1544451 RepID=UPI00093CA5FC|nr:hypothetical protein [Thalassospira sp. TSL5-1]OKH89209.1 hypothetical protein LF95_04030 [Thalassospira sp. TSL5-1]
MTANVDWPDQLPLPTFQGYNIEPTDSILRTEMESGAARQRAQFTQTPTRIAVRWRFTMWQFALFESWWKHKAREGAAYFNITLLGGLGMVDHEARFIGKGSGSYTVEVLRGGKAGNPDYRQGVTWIVSSTLEVRERAILSDEALDIALQEDVPGLIAAINDVHSLIHTTMPGPATWS